MVLICNGPEIVLRCGSCCTEIHHNTSATTLGSLGRPRKPWARELAKTPEKSQVGTIAAQSVWPRLLTRMNQWMSSARIRRVAGEDRAPDQDNPHKLRSAAGSESDFRAICWESRRVLLSAHRASTFLCTSSGFVERSRPWPGRSVALSELIVQRHARGSRPTQRLPLRLTLGPVLRDLVLKVRASLPLALLRSLDGAHALFNDSTLLTVPARHGAPAPRGRRATASRHHGCGKHPCWSLRSCGTAPHWCLLLAMHRCLLDDVGCCCWRPIARSAWARHSRRVRMKPHARCNAHHRRTALRAIPMDMPASRPRPQRCSISLPAF